MTGGDVDRELIPASLAFGRLSRAASRRWISRQPLAVCKADSVSVCVHFERLQAKSDAQSGEPNGTLKPTPGPLIEVAQQHSTSARPCKSCTDASLQHPTRPSAQMDAAMQPKSSKSRFCDRVLSADQARQERGTRF